MYWLDLKKWNGQWKNPKLTYMLRVRIHRMIDEYRSTMMVNCDKCDIDQASLEAILKDFPSDKVKCQGDMSPTSFHRWRG